MIKIYKFVSSDSDKYSRENSYFDGKERIGYEVKRIDSDELLNAKKGGWTCELPTKPVKAAPKKAAPKKAKANVKNSKVSNSISSTESGGSTDKVQASDS